MINMIGGTSWGSLLFFIHNRATSFFLKPMGREMYCFKSRDQKNPCCKKAMNPVVCTDVRSDGLNAHITMRLFQP